MRIARSLVLLALLVPSSSLFASSVPLYDSLRTARPDGRVSPVTNVVLQRDAYRFTFESGTFHYLAPVDGRTFGAIFIGQGHYDLTPATESERAHLALVTRKNDLKTLSDHFEKLVLLFGDATAAEIAKASPVQTRTPDPNAGSVYDAYLDKQKKTFQVNVHARLLADFLNGTAGSNGFFLAYVDGKDLAPSIALVDPMGIGNLSAQYIFFGGEQTAFINLDDNNGGFWYLSSLAGEAKDGHGKPHRAVVDATRYVIDTDIAKNNSITGTTTIEFKGVFPNVRALNVHLLPELDVDSVEYSKNGTDGWSAIGFVEENAGRSLLSKMIHSGVVDGDVSIVLAQPLAAGETAFVRFKYHGSDVIHDAGGHNYVVGARDSWYPNFGTFVDTAQYDLTFHYRKGNDLISVGTRVSEETQGDDKVAHWKSDQAIRVAGFNYGKFDKIEKDDTDAKVKIAVFTNPDAPFVNTSTKAIAEGALTDAINTARVGKIFFGAVPFSSISVTEQTEWNYGQSWPTLVFMPTLAFIDSTTKMEMLDESEALPTDVASINEFTRMVGPHEFAHQWWGHMIGWESYRDQWLSEGFAEFTAALVTQFTGTLRKYDDYWEATRKDIVQKKAGAIAPADAGPMTLGYRLYTQRSGSAPQAIIYGKGAFVLHMLRMLMRDPKNQNPDTAFIDMMHDFVTTYSGKNPSTADFEKTVERHMQPRMDLAGTGNMAWFFNQWVYGTGVPSYKSTLTIKETGGGKYHLAGTITQEGVAEDFRVVMPVSIDFGGDHVAQVGAVPLKGNQTYNVDVQLPLPKKPKKVVINAMHEILARN